MLVQGTEPLVLADGTKIDPEDGCVVTDEILVAYNNFTIQKNQKNLAHKDIFLI